MKKYKYLFSSEFSVVEDVKVHLVKKEWINSKFFKARLSLYTLADNGDLEIVRFVEKGIVEPVKTVEWTAPIVPILKREVALGYAGILRLLLTTLLD